MRALDELDAVIAAALDEREIGYQRKEPGQFFATLPGSKKLQTNCWLVVGRHSLLVEAFVCRRPDEAHEDVYRFLLRRNSRLYGVHYTIDQAGDVYLIGRIGHHAVTADELDRVLGQVAGAIRREWDWRVSRGESVANLQAFTHLLER